MCVCVCVCWGAGRGAITNHVSDCKIYSYGRMAVSLLNTLCCNRKFRKLFLPCTNSVCTLDVALNTPKTFSISHQTICYKNCCTFLSRFFH